MKSENDQGSALKALVRSVRSTLKNGHGVDVPYAALRASLVHAQGENPHAFAKKSFVASPERMVAYSSEMDKMRKLVAEAPKFFHPGYDFDGDKEAWLLRAGLIHDLNEDGPTAPQSKLRPGKAHVNDPTYQLWLVPAEDESCGVRLALDPLGEFWVPASWRFKSATLVRQRVAVFNLEQVGFPDCYKDAHVFYGQHFGIHAEDASEDSQAVRVREERLQKAVALVRMPELEWLELLAGVLRNKDNDIDVAGTVAEWVGLHYKKNFSTMKKTQQADYLARYLRLGATKDLQLEHDVQLEWVWPDEDSDSVPAKLNVLTGEVTALGDVPHDTLYEGVRVCVSINDGEDHFEVTPAGGNSTMMWLLDADDMAQVIEALSSSET